MIFKKIKLTPLFCAILCIAVVNSASSSSETNEIDQSAPIHIDPILRKALLKALSNIQKDSKEEKPTNDEEYAEIATTDQPDEILDESTPIEIVKQNNVHFHSFIVENKDNKTDSNVEEVIKTIIVPRSTFSPPKEDVRTDDEVIINFHKIDPNTDGDVKSETVQVTRSVTNTIKANEIKIEKKSTKPKLNSLEKYSVLNKPRTTTVPPTTIATTTTTPAPTHNAEGENIEKVNDVQIFQAPLVAAFTVQQDSLGQPRNVIPLFKPVEQNNLVQTRSRFSDSAQSIQSVQGIELKPLVPTRTHFQVQPTHNQFPVQQPQQHFTIQQSVSQPQHQLNKYNLEQKQRELEQQISFLQNQNRQQEHLLRNQQIYQEQQNLQRQQQFFLEQRLKLEEEHRLRLQRYEQEQRIFRQQEYQKQRFLQQQQQQQRHINNVQFIPSVSLQTPALGISIQQQLPVKDAVAFRPSGQTFNNNGQQQQQQIQQQQQNQQQQQIQQQQQNQQQQQIQQQQQNQQHQQQNIITQQQVTQLPTGQELPQKPFQLFNNNLATQQLPEKLFQSFNNNPASISPVNVEITQSVPLNRVFRHEGQQTGNFGFNYQPETQANTQLHNLFAQSGISGRSSEDLNIIAKVLSLNHGVSANNNFLGDSRRFV